jgi:AcrR family transcriptional regulator
MARPSKPLISREAAVRVALEIIDNQGLDAFSLPRLANEMNVKTPSLYNHFKDKSDILTAVAAAVVAKTEMPPHDAPIEWTEWFARLALNFRISVLHHHRAAPLLLRSMPRELLINLYEYTSVYLASAGVPARLHVPLLDGLEKLALGATLTEAMRPQSSEGAQPFLHNVSPHDQPSLAQAVAENHPDSEELFEGVVRSYLQGFKHFAGL